MTTVVLSNLTVYFSIAREALDKSRELDAAETQPMGEGHAGKIITFDPGQGSFKQSLIAIIFAGVYLDALIYVATHKRRHEGVKSPETQKGLGRYESALVKLGIADAEILTAVRQLNDARNEIAHEKAVAITNGEVSSHELRTAQHEAEHAVKTIQRVSQCLGVTL